LKAHFELTESLEAPIEKGQVVGKLFLQLEGENIATYPLVTLHEVQEGGLIDKAKDWISLKLGFES
jgi:D-alanyl-D-alanine carboxypeptidase (penicillin-binding protein 5/6)